MVMDMESKTNNGRKTDPKLDIVFSEAAKNQVSGLSLVETLIENIISRWNPKEIWLFGSRAKGEARGNSDWDLFVIADDSVPESEFDPLVAWNLQRDSGVRADIFLCNDAEFNEYKNVTNTLSYRVSREGVLLYER